MSTPFVQRLNLDRLKIPRTREVRSCQQCRASKVKCDKSEPCCQRCLATNRNCVYMRRVQKAGKKCLHRKATDRSTKPPPTYPQPSDGNQRDQTICLNQVSNLTVGHDAQSSPWLSTVEDTASRPDIIESLSPFCTKVAASSSRSLNANLQPSDKSQRDQTIWLHQLGNLTAGHDSQIRYYSSSSWLSAVENTASRPGILEGLSPFQSQVTASSSRKLEELPAGQIYNFLQLDEVDRLICWYLQFCHFWYPIIDIPEILNSLRNLRGGKSSPTGSSALIAAICYSAACSVEASSDLKSFNIKSSSWKILTRQLLSMSRYPLQPNLNIIRAAFLLATPSLVEWKAHPDPTLICVTVHAAHSLGLHRDPSSFKLSPAEIDFRRVLWWSIYVLDISYALAHALPPLINLTNSDVKMMSGGAELDRKLLSTSIRIGLLLSRVFQEIYGVRQLTRNIVQQLDQEVAMLCADEIKKPQLPQQSQSQTLERFIAISQRLSCWKMTFILHQPYLRSTQWPQSSRQKALAACQDYITEFSTCVIDPTLAPYRWVLNHFNVIHACAVILQDLIQYSKSIESSGLQSTVQTCFSIFGEISDPSWEKLEALRLKAWAANQWSLDEGQRDDGGLLGVMDASLSDWDPLFASFPWDDLSLS